MESAQAERAEVDVPFAVIDLYQANLLVAQGLTDVYPVLVPADPAVATHPADLVVAGILQRGEVGGVGSRGRGVERGRRRIVERLMGAERVVLVAPPIEAALLVAPAVARRPRAFALERQMHALVPAVLLRGAGLDEIGDDAEADPPDRERGEAPEGLGGEGDAVIGADAPGEAVLAEEALEDGPGLDQPSAGERLASEQQAAVPVGDGEGKAVLAIAQFELALVVRGPYGIGGVHAAPGGPAGPGRRTRRRAVTSPKCWKQRATVERTGQGASGHRWPTRWSNFRGPQYGWR
jgi:hypothetical protein